MWVFLVIYGWFWSKEQKNEKNLRKSAQSADLTSGTICKSQNSTPSSFACLQMRGLWRTFGNHNELQLQLEISMMCLFGSFWLFHIAMGCFSTSRLLSLPLQFVNRSRRKIKLLAYRAFGHQDALGHEAVGKPVTLFRCFQQAFFTHRAGRAIQIKTTFPAKWPGNASKRYRHRKTPYLCVLRFFPSYILEDHQK